MAASLVMLGGVTSANAAIIVGKCTMKIGNPHGSTHVAGTINSLSTIQCTLTMPDVHIQTWLYKKDGKYWTGKADSRVNVAAGKKMQSNAFTSCKEGPATFRTRTYVQFTSPPRTTPGSHSNIYYSPWMSVSCGVARIAPEPAGDLLVDMSVFEDGSIKFSEPRLETADSTLA